MKTKKRMFKSAVMVSIFASAIAITGTIASAAIPAGSQAPDDAAKRRIESAYLNMPMVFELNQGQTKGQDKFLARGSGYNLLLTPSEAVLALEKSLLRMRLVNANTSPNLKGLEKLDGKINYIIGKDPKKWRTNIPVFAKVKYHNVYPGIDMIYYGKQRQLEYDFVVAPGADPKTIKLAYEGQDKLEIDTNGDLVLHIADREIRMLKPFIYQMIHGT
ncbi:MAG: hypothetical protein AAB256_03845, partial [Deltaproteobacteria bacterium]